MSRRRAKPATPPTPLDARPAEEIAAAVRAVTERRRVGDIIPSTGEGGGEILIIGACSDGVQAVAMSMVTLILGALEIRKARRS